MMLGDMVQRVMPYLYWNHLFAVGPSEILPDIQLKKSYNLLFPCALEGVFDDAFCDVSIDRKLVEARIKKGDLLGLIFCGDRIVHRTLVQTHGMAQMEGDPKAFLLQQGEKYIHSCYTSAAHRGEGLYPAMLNKVAWACSGLDQAGLLYIACRRENQFSIKGIQRAGYIYRKSSRVLGLLSGKIRLRLWYLDPTMHIGSDPAEKGPVENIPACPD